MTISIPDSWELPAYTAGDLVPMEDWEHLRRDRITDNIGGAPVVPLNDKTRREIQRIKRSRPAPEPAPEPYDWEAAAERMRNIKPYDPSDYPDRDFYNQDDLDHLAQHGFSPTGDPGVWSRHVIHPSGQAMAAQHILTYDPGHRRPTTGERAPWVLTTNPDTVGIAFPSLRGDRGAMAAANADQEAVRRMSRVGAFITHLSHLMFKTAADKTPAQIAAEKWLEENPEEFETWNPSHSDYTYPDFTDVAGQSFGDDDEGTSHVMPGSAYDFNRGHGEENEGGWSPTDEESGDPEPHEQDLADLGFNWQNRGDRDTTPVGEYLEGEYVRHQHDPEGRHVATHTIRRVPYSNTWHVESTDPSDSNFAYESSDHRFAGDAISRYHDNAERALLPTRGYEPHRGRSGAITHWTRTDTDPHSGQQYEHEIENQPPEGENVGTGWLGHTVSEGMIAPSYGTNALRRHDLADVVREQDRTGRGLHPGGSQDYRATKAELLADPSVARLGTPSYISDNFHGDNKVGKTIWQLPHPTDTEHPINVEANYNWDKGGYDFGYTHDGQRIYPTSEHFPAGAPVHVPGRQTRLPLEGAS